MMSPFRPGGGTHPRGTRCGYVTDGTTGFRRGAQGTWVLLQPNEKIRFLRVVRAFPARRASPFASLAAGRELPRPAARGHPPPPRGATARGQVGRDATRWFQGRCNNGRHDRERARGRQYIILNTPG